MDSAAPSAAPLEAILYTAISRVLLNSNCQAKEVATICHDASNNAPAERLTAGYAGMANDSAPILAAAVPVAPLAGARAKAHRWEPDELEALLSLLKAADHAGSVPTQRGLEVLGWATRPDPGGVLQRRVRNKLIVMRNRIRHGEEPMPARAGTHHQNKATTWTAWIRAAVSQLGDSEFTSAEVASMLDADPDISPLLDRRPDPDYKTRLRWQSNFWYTFKNVPGIVKTGRKRGRRQLFRYDPTDPTSVPASRRRQRKKGVPGLPHLGRHEKSKGDFAAAGQRG